MIDKIFNDYKKQEFESEKQYYSIIGMEKKIKFENRIQRENLDLITILSNLGLIEKNNDNLSIINDFYEYLFKYGIELGVADGKRIIISALEKDEITTDDIMNLDYKKFTEFKFASPLIRSDLYEK